MTYINDKYSRYAFSSKKKKRKEKKFLFCPVKCTAETDIFTLIHKSPADFCIPVQRTSDSFPAVYVSPAFAFGLFPLGFRSVHINYNFSRRGRFARKIKCCEIIRRDGHSVIILFQQFNVPLFASYSHRVSYNAVPRIIAPGLLHTIHAR